VAYRPIVKPGVVVGDTPGGDPDNFVTVLTEKGKQVVENALGRKIAPGKKRRQVTMSIRQLGKILLGLKCLQVRKTYSEDKKQTSPV